MTGTTTGTIAELKPELRNLVDNRLDAIDRILIDARVARTERTNILGDVESQIYDMLASNIGEREPTRRDVLDVLARLDPPEAYAADDDREVAVKPRPRVAPETRPTPEPRPAEAPVASRTPVTGVLACAGGLITFFLALPGTMLLTILAGDGDSGMIFILLEVVLLLAVGLPSFILGILSARTICLSHGKFDNITCAAIGIAALPVCAINTLMMVTVAAESVVGIVLLGCFYVTLGCVGAVHLVYRVLDVMCAPGASSRAA